MPTVAEAYEGLHSALRSYIEATYHISDPGLIDQRRQLLDELGTIRQKPYLETTPRYRTGKHFRDMELHSAAAEILTSLSSEDAEHRVILHDPPFRHQEEALVATQLHGKSAVITTGTGSGKTECFLMPILASLAAEASESGERFGQSHAIRALILYPMNALVNDQLGRLRQLFGDNRVSERFVSWAGRPARFARYTSRTPYPGVRTLAKDQLKLRSIGNFYVRHQTEQSDSEPAHVLVKALRDRGKWPSKPDLAAWFGTSGARWQDPSSGEFLRCVALPDDVELLTRHEVIAAPPDVLVTNYSMLEYMLMRPIERPIFDSTRAWLRSSPDSKFFLVIDEAHLYRGAAGTEVSLLLRRLRNRLGIRRDRLQVVCTSASFSNRETARAFAAQLAGKDESDVVCIEGELDLGVGEGSGTLDDARALASVNLDHLHATSDVETKQRAVADFFKHVSASHAGNFEQQVFDALESFAPLVLLRNRTMSEAVALDDLAGLLFPSVDSEIADRACAALLTLGSLAKASEESPPLLPCRVHSFHRGLPGLWVCMDPQCSSLDPEQRGGVAGKMYGQPRDTCECGARVLELYTCRNCGTAYARGYTDDAVEPRFLWGTPGEEIRTVSGVAGSMHPIDLLLESPVDESVGVESVEFDLVTGRLNPAAAGSRTREVFIRNDEVGRARLESEGNQAPGEFRPCAVCGQQSSFGRSSVQDHVTKGDEPYLALIAEQLRIQQQSKTPTGFAPLGGRKVLVFSDSRQVAARLAPNLQSYSIRDVLRPLIARGFARLSASPGLTSLLSLDDLYLAILLGASELGVRLRPALGSGESFALMEKVDRIPVDNEISVELLIEARTESAPAALLSEAMRTVRHPYYGLESLALASLTERQGRMSNLAGLPPISGLAETEDEKLAYVRQWLRCWQGPGIWVSQMPHVWWRGHGAFQAVRPHTGRFQQFDRLLGSSEARASFREDWLPTLLSLFTESVDGESRARGREISLAFGGEWGYCTACGSTQRKLPNRATCARCGNATVETIDPNTNPVFVARKGYYRESTTRALREPPERPLAIIAAEHTAQLNRTQDADVFSLAEEHELLFQDVDIACADDAQLRFAIDVLSCTTTMEVGIDIGTLTGVSLRNMPPSRANYQQRSGRAGRRGTSVATVTAFGSADSHDEHYFSHPEQMIRGRTRDPVLSLNNAEITRRHITAFLLQSYHQDRLPDTDVEENAQLFEVLGTVGSFISGSSILNRADFEEWLRSREDELREELRDCLRGIGGEDVDALLQTYVDEILSSIDHALGVGSSQTNDESEDPPVESETPGSLAPELAPELGDELAAIRPTEHLLDRLLFSGVLPRYAFPTDVVSFYVFDRANSTRFRPAFLFAPQQSLPAALSQYVPGREVWIGNRLWTSGALYSPYRSDLSEAWSNRMLYFECRECHYAYKTPLGEGAVGQTLDCPACGGAATLGPAQNWIRPPGFAHPVYVEEGTSPDDQPPRSYATRAKLSAPAPGPAEGWRDVSDGIRTLYWRKHLLVTNRGPLAQGYSTCIRCGAIAPTSASNASSSLQTTHLKPYPDEREGECPGNACTHGLVLGAEFLSDILLISLKVSSPLSLQPGMLSTEVALRTLCEAVARAGTELLELEPGDVVAEHRPALTSGGAQGLEAEIYIYDTLPGGAGFAHRLWDCDRELLEKALAILQQCPEGCSESCYRCLRSYKNRMDHSLLDRHLGAGLLSHLLYGTPLVLPEDRIKESTDILFEDLCRQAGSAISFERSSALRIPGLGDILAPILATSQSGQQYVVGLHSPLAPLLPIDPSLEPVSTSEIAVPVILKDELVVRRNLPSVTSELLLDLV